MSEDISLLNFFVFNSEYGPREGEEEKKILFYYPGEVDVDTKIKRVGLSEAIIKFSETFSDKPCQSLHTQKTRQVFYEPEQCFWIVMTVAIPFKEKIKDGQPFTEYRDDHVQDSVYEAILRQAYKMFKLFNGTFTTILARANGEVEALKQRLEHFYDKYLLTLKLAQGDILDVFNGIHFLPLDKNTYLRIQCFINSLEATFPFVKYTAFLYNEKLVWSGLEQEDMRIMYKYLTHSLFPTFMEQELHGGQNRPPVTSGHYGKFMTGPPNLNDDRNMGKLPRVYVNTEEIDEECYLLVYTALSATICLLVNVRSPLTVPLCRKLDSMLGPQMTKLASDISEQYNKRVAALNSTEPVFKYVYFNHMNLAQQTTVHIDLQKRSGVNIHKDVLRLLGDINADLTKENEDGETIVKTTSDVWVVGKKSDQREFYVIITQRTANLIDINEEVKRLCSTYLNSIFFLD
ncbi:vacuolar fusion protein CCZ1 [Biomphalaria glabrata]|uniref:Vacuolar fusion protein CCZ1 homolog isoform X1 n=2 Tax=Biomphalaria glabrata TaxID=6526 RepID=A0A9W2ZN03_BIOGL|nr:vacuolar fusion protein CCZ1 homolog isoform X1 [Biomphalaria glabrata]XP_055876334.1 vacuolar fusion protein CCZ1 homolog isoform X1 [Biomphalaria glabrata]XP_055876335.1 vacuolar fusion protein CCZ1 homolog isoform X1 [Biomphalaria glabrata]XP_055876336.1 vacuolar fusion protein CCZ1 homolog isoform X1 [Biomphalaria glabrata]KAI8765558.1 putative vacuolar fusion protein CCZ1 [Biomphalaria glabrata]KAI8797551.1 vacuolar fusion protein CCZ1 [Biomphalaria glabrata]